MITRKALAVLLVFAACGSPKSSLDAAGTSSDLASFIDLAVASGDGASTPPGDGASPPPGDASTPSGDAATAAASNFWIYQDASGTGDNYTNALWGDDLSSPSDATWLNGHDTTHPQSGHTYDLYGDNTNNYLWQPATSYYDGKPYGTGPFGYDISSYTWLTIDLWTAHPADDFDSQAEYVGSYNGANGATDQPISAWMTSLAAIPLAGGTQKINTSAWTYQLKIPFAYLGWIQQHAAYKFFFRDNSGSAWYVDNVGLVPGASEWIHSGGAANSWNATTSKWNDDASTLLNGWTDASVSATANYSYNPSALTQLARAACGMSGLSQPGQSAACPNVIEVAITAAGGAWKIVDTASKSLASYDYLTFALLPTKAGYSYTVQFYGSGGIALGAAVNPSAWTQHDWGTGSGKGTTYWTVYGIPLSSFGLGTDKVYGLSIKDTSGVATNTFYITAPAFFR